jgi:CAS/CSE protein, C-terminus
MRALFRVIQLAQQSLIPYAETLGQLLASFINEVIKDQSSPSPNYVYILFEASASTLRSIKQNAAAFA